MLKKLIFFLITCISIYSIEINEIVQEKNIIKNNYGNEYEPRVYKNNYLINSFNETTVESLVESEEFKKKYGEIFFYQQIFYKEMGINFLRLYLLKNDNTLNIPVNIVDFYSFSKTNKAYFLVYLQTTLSKNSILSIIKDKKIQWYSELTPNFPGEILIENIPLLNLKYNEYDAFLEIKKTKEGYRYSIVQIFFEEIQVFFNNIFSKRKKYAYNSHYNKSINREIEILDNILMYLKTNNKEILDKINYVDLNKIGAFKNSTNPVLKNLSLGFKMKFYKDKMNDEKLEENIDEKMQSSLNDEIILRSLSRITRDKLEYENNKLKNSYDNNFY